MAPAIVDVDQLHGVQSELDKLLIWINLWPQTSGIQVQEGKQEVQEGRSSTNALYHFVPSTPSYMHCLAIGTVEVRARIFPFFVVIIFTIVGFSTSRSSSAFRSTDIFISSFGIHGLKCANWQAFVNPNFLVLRPRRISNPQLRFFCESSIHSHAPERDQIHRQLQD